MNNKKENAIEQLNKVVEQREKMAGFISYKKANGKNKSDAWFDRVERKLLKRSYQSLYNEYKKLKL